MMFAFLPDLFAAVFSILVKMDQKATICLMDLSSRSKSRTMPQRSSGQEMLYLKPSSIFKRK